ncbi:MAG: hypothetical protein K2H34_03825 [Lachnospiraceae bacterium]|nr:hypothetical protein [Lachnospiraceae bacterium]
MQSKIGYKYGGNKVKKGLYITIIGIVCLWFVVYIPVGAYGDSVSGNDDVVIVSNREELYRGISKQIKEHRTAVRYNMYQGAVGSDMEEVIEGYFYHYNTENPLDSGSYLCKYVRDRRLTFEYGHGDFVEDYNFQIEVQVQYDYTKDELDEYFAYMHELAGTLKKETDYKSVKSVHDYLIKNFEYDYSLNNHLDYEGYLTGSMVCEGYCMAAFFLLSDMGIPVRIVNGSAKDFETDPDHAWNVVNVEGKWYNMDVTWDDKGGRKLPAYTFFLKSDVDFYQHTREGKYDYDRDMAIVSYDMPDKSTEIFTIIFILAMVIVFVVIRSRISREDTIF